MCVCVYIFMLMFIHVSVYLFLYVHTFAHQSSVDSMCSSQWCQLCQVAVRLVAQLALVELRQLIGRLVVPVLHGLGDAMSGAAWLGQQVTGTNAARHVQAL